MLYQSEIWHLGVLGHSGITQLLGRCESATLFRTFKHGSGRVKLCGGRKEAFKCLPCPPFRGKWSECKSERASVGLGGMGTTSSRSSDILFIVTLMRVHVFLERNCVTCDYFPRNPVSPFTPHHVHVR